MKRDRRLAHFQIPMSYIYHHPDVVRAFFRELDALVVEARFLFDVDAIDYLLHSPKLPLLTEQEAAKRIHLNHFSETRPANDEHTHHVEFVKILPNSIGFDLYFLDGKQDEHAFHGP